MLQRDVNSGTISPYIPPSARIGLPYYNQHDCFYSNAGQENTANIWSPIAGHGVENACYLNSYSASTTGYTFFNQSTNRYITCTGSENSLKNDITGMATCLSSGNYCWESNMCYYSKSSTASVFSMPRNFVNSNTMLARIGQFSIQDVSGNTWRVSNDGNNYITPNRKNSTQIIQFQLDMTMAVFNNTGSYGMLYSPTYSKYVFNLGAWDSNKMQWALKSFIAGSSSGNDFFCKL